MEIEWQGHETGNNFEVQLMCDYDAGYYFGTNQ